jgi:hypothetical protein
MAVKLPRHHDVPPDPLDLVREITAELERRFVDVGALVGTAGTDLDAFTAGVHDTACRLLEMAEAATENTREATDAG